MTQLDVSTPSVPILYTIPYFCSSIPTHVALELKIPPTELVIKQITEDDLRKGPEMPKISPRRVVPVLALPDGSLILEVGAIVMWLLENFDKDHTLHPRIGDRNRARMFQAMFYMVAECHPASKKVHDVCFRVIKEDRDQKKLKEVTAGFEKVVNDHLVKELEKKGPYYLGEEYSVADIMMSYALMDGDCFDCELIQRDVIVEYFRKLSSRNTYRKMYWMEDC